MRAMRSTCARASASNGTPIVQAWIGDPPSPLMTWWVGDIVVFASLVMDNRDSSGRARTPAPARHRKPRPAVPTDPRLYLNIYKSVYLWLDVPAPADGHW